MMSDPVTLWLWELREGLELECTSLLISKTITPRKKEEDFLLNESFRKAGRSQNAGNLRRISSKPEMSSLLMPASNKFPSQFQLQDDEEELFLSGNIPVGGECTEDSKDDYGIPLVPEHQFEKQSSSSSDDSGHFTRSYRTDFSQSNNQWESPFESKGVHNSPDSASLDSACGSSPSFQPSAEGSPQNSLKQLEKLHRTSILSAHANGLPFLQSYVQLKDAIEGILALSSQIYTHFGASSSRHKTWPERYIHAVEGLLWLVESSGISHFLSQQELSTIKDGLSQLRTDQRDLIKREEYVEFLRKYTEKVLVHVGKIILRHICEQGNRNSHLPNALEHLAHVALFGEAICLQLIQLGSISHLIRLCRHIWTPTEVVRLSLRASAVLCGASKGCVQLLSVGGLDLIVRLLLESPFVSAVEAAGVLTQLTAPCHSFATLPASLNKVISRLLDLCEQCEDPECYLLCVAALANLSLQHSSVSDQLYRHNAVLRLTTSFAEPKCQSIFVQDQIVTLFARLSANGYDQALIAQGAVPCLLSLLRNSTERQAELRLRIRYKAAISLGTLAANSFGLHAIYSNRGLMELQNAIEEERRREVGVETPIAMICSSLLNRLLSKYQQESAV